MNYGYACINMTLSDVPKSKRITTNRSMIKRTFLKEGIKRASELALQNVLDLEKILKWNEQNDIDSTACLQTSSRGPQSTSTTICRTFLLSVGY